MPDYKGDHIFVLRSKAGIEPMPLEERGTLTPFPSTYELVLALLRDARKRIRQVRWDMWFPEPVGPRKAT
ncbi:MAG TPA: hypothetical protein VNA25_30745, partial [Phycisphaerae bacterium]|nr:hypothetical protein [Phycisphaerae bacterium]